MKDGSSTLHWESISALFSAATLGGCVALSCYLPGGGNPSVSIQGLETPILQVFLIICTTHIRRINFCPQAHGDCDEVVSYKRGQLTAEVVERLSKRHKMITYPGMGHEGTLVSRDQQNVDYLRF